LIINTLTYCLHVLLLIYWRHEKAIFKAGFQAIQSEAAYASAAIS
jgi:hypothetical protein